MKRQENSLSDQERLDGIRREFDAFRKNLQGRRPKFSSSLKAMVLAEIEMGSPIEELSQIAGVHHSSIRRWQKEFKQSNAPRAKSLRVVHKPRTEIQETFSGSAKIRMGPVTIEVPVAALTVDLLKSLTEVGGQL